MYPSLSGNIAANIAAPFSVFSSEVTTLDERSTAETGAVMRLSALCRMAWTYGDVDIWGVIDGEDNERPSRLSYHRDDALKS